MSKGVIVLLQELKFNNQHRDITGLMKGTDTKSKVRAGNSDAGMESKDKVSVSGTRTGAQGSGCELTSQPCFIADPML